MTSYLMAIEMFALSLIIYEIIAYREKCQNVNLENEGKGIEERN